MSNNSNYCRTELRVIHDLPTFYVNIKPYVNHKQLIFYVSEK